MSSDISCVFEGMGSCGAIYISSLAAAQNVQLLTKLNIRAIVTILGFKPFKHSPQYIDDHLHIVANDTEEENLTPHFQTSFYFLEKWRKKTNVLVHCYAGISRSATIVISYLLRKYQYGLENVIALVKRKRKKVLFSNQLQINPNRGFLQQLKQQANKRRQSQQEDREIDNLLKKRKNIERKKVYPAIKSSATYATVKQTNIKSQYFQNSKQTPPNKLQLKFGWSDEKVLEPSQRLNEKISKIKEKIMKQKKRSSRSCLKYSNSNLKCSESVAQQQSISLKRREAASLIL